MHRFFVPAEWLAAPQITLSGPLAHQIYRVLRLAPGARILLLDNTGWAYEAELDRVAPKEVLAHVVGRWQPQTEPRVRIVLYQALLKEQKFNWVLQKGTELGVAAFVPVMTERCVVNLREERGKRARWSRIITEAAEQCGRARLPELHPVIPWTEICALVKPDALWLLAWESPEAPPLGQELRALGDAPTQVCLCIGPEGGLTPAEVALGKDAGMRPVSLGPRILRAETAGLAAVAALHYALGELG